MISSFSYIIQALTFIYIALLTGEIIIENFKLSVLSYAKSIYAIAIGYGILSLIATVFAASSIYTKVPFLILFIIIILLSRKKIIAHITRLASLDFYKNIINNIRKSRPIIILLWSIIAVWILLYFLISLFPPAMGSDGLTYHLPFAINIVEKGSMSFPLKGAFSLEGDVKFGHLPISIEILYGILILFFRNLVNIKIIQFSAFTLLLFTILKFARRHFKNEISTIILSMILLSNMPLIKVALDAGEVDIFTLLFGILSILLLVDLILENSDKDDIHNTISASGLLLGLALSTKYIAFFFGILDAILFIYFVITKKYGTKKIIKLLGFFTAPILLASGFWYIKNIIYTGDPVFPILTKSGQEFTRKVGAFVIEPKIWNFPLFPFSFFGKGMLLKLPFAIMTAFYFIGSYIMGFFLIIKNRLNKFGVIFFLSAETYLFMMFFWSHQLRFSIAALIFILIFFTAALDEILSILKERCGNKRLLIDFYFALVVTCLCVILLLASVFAMIKQDYMLCYLNETTPHNCISKSMGYGIYATDYINNNLKNEAVIEYWNVFYKFSLINNNRYIYEDCGIGASPSKGEVIRNCLQIKNIKYLVDDTERRGMHKYPVVEYFLKNADIVFERFDPENNSFIRIYKLR